MLSEDGQMEINKSIDDLKLMIEQFLNHQSSMLFQSPMKNVRDKREKGWRKLGNTTGKRDCNIICRRHDLREKRDKSGQ